MATRGTRPSWGAEVRYEILTGQDGLDFVGQSTFDRVVVETARRHLDGAFLTRGTGVWQHALEHSWCVATVSDNEAKVNAFVAHLHRNLEHAGLRQDVIKVNRGPTETMLVAFPNEAKPKPTTRNGRQNGHTNNGRRRASASTR